MGVLDAIGDGLESINESTKDVTDATLDNEVFSVQDTVRNTAADLQGKTEEEFAETNSSFWENISNPLFDQVSAESGDGLGAKAGEGVETFADWTVGYFAQEGNSALTGVTPENKVEEGEDPSTEYAPGAAPVAEGLFTLATGGAGKVATGAARGGGRAAVRAGSAAAKGAKGANKSDMALGSIIKGVTRKADDVLDFGRTKAQTTLKPGGSSNGVKRNLDDATEDGSDVVDDIYTAGGSGGTDDVGRSISDILGGGARTAGGAAASGGRKATDLVSNNKLLIGGGLFAGGLGAAFASPKQFPDNYSIVETFEGPKARIIQETDGVGNTLGYWLSIGSNGSTITSLTSYDTSAEVTFPTDKKPPFASRGQATSVYTKYQSEVNNNQGGRPDTASGENGRPTPTSQAWGEMTSVRSMGKGMYLFKQDANGYDATRYFVAGRNTSKNLVFVNKNGVASRQPYPFEQQSNAQSAYDKYASMVDAGNARVKADPSIDRPQGRAVLNKTKDMVRRSSGSGGGFGTYAILALLGVGTIAAAFAFGVI